MSRHHQLSCPVAEIYISRSSMTLEVRGDSSQILRKCAIGIGRGGLKEKTSMSDLVTPIGEFVVDLILYNDPRYSRVSSEITSAYNSNEEFKEFFTDQTGLEKLFSNMNKLDFNEDGVPDQAYGVGYIGLDSKTAITGPKMRLFNERPYWFSIALHGTPDPTNIGRANSGGCVHLERTLLDWLITEKRIAPGLKVSIVE